MWRFCVNPVAEASHAFSFHKQIAQQKCVSPDLKDLRISYFLGKKGIVMDSGNQFLGTERMGKLMRQYAIPCIISLLVGALYNIVDQIFIANASYLGSYSV